MLQNPLAGVIRCKKCASIMTRLGANGKTPYAAIKCSNPRCKTVSSPLYLVEEELLRALNDWANGIEWKVDTGDLYTPKTKMTEKTIEKLEKEITTIDGQMSRTYDLLEQGIYTAEVFTERSRQLTERRKELEKKIAETREREAKKIETAELQKGIIPKIKSALKTYPTLTDAETKNEILKTLIENATYEKDMPNSKNKKEEIHFKLEVFPYTIPQIAKHLKKNNL